MKDRGNILDKKIEHFIEANKAKYCFKVGNYSIPKILITNNKAKIDLIKNRNKLLKQANSPYAQEMEKYLISQGINYIKELTIIIQDYRFWENIIEFLNPINKEKEEYLNKNYFSMDFFIPDYLLCVEVDSDFHNNRKILDQARDYYIRGTFSIDTVRFYHFGESLERDRENLVYLKSKLSQPPQDNSNIFNYTDVLISNFKYENEYLLIMLDRLNNFVGNLSIARKVTITEKDYNNLAYNLTFDNNSLVYPMMLVDDFINLTRNLFNCDLTVCKGVSNYSIIDITYILNNPNIDIRRYILSTYNSVPFWISKLINISSEYSCYIRPKTYEDDIILKNIRNGIIR